MSVCCEFCVLSGRGHCVGPITRLEKSSRRGVSECGREECGCFLVLCLI